VLALLIYEALKERKSNGGRVPVSGLLAITAAALIGLVDERIQAIIPSRVFGPVDIGFNALAASMAIAAAPEDRRQWRP